jgi:hypothetical protein
VAVRTHRASAEEVVREALPRLPEHQMRATIAVLGRVPLDTLSDAARDALLDALPVNIVLGRVPVVLAARRRGAAVRRTREGT